MARIATEQEKERIENNNAQSQPPESGQKLLNPKSKILIIQDEEIEVKKWNLGQLTELGSEIANLVLVLQDAQGDAGMVIAILSSKLPLVNKVCQMTLNRDEEFCKTIDGDELLDIYETCAELNGSFFRRFKSVLPEGLINLETNQTAPQSGTVSEEIETQISPQTTGSTSSIGLSPEDTNSTQENIPGQMESPVSNTEESSPMTMTNSSGSSSQPTEHEPSTEVNT